MTNSILITPGMVDDQALIVGVTKSMTGIGIPCLNFVNGMTSMLRLNTPIPSDWDGTPITLTTMYTSNGVSGDFMADVDGSGLLVNEPLNVQFSNPMSLLSPPTDVNVVCEWISTIDFNTGPAPNFLNILIRRNGTHPEDTSTDILQLMGFILKYNTNQ